MKWFLIILAVSIHDVYTVVDPLPDDWRGLQRLHYETFKECDDVASQIIQAYEDTGQASGATGIIIRALCLPIPKGPYE